MFNRESFNRGKFNVSSGNQQVSGRALISLKTLDAQGSLIITAPPGIANIVINSIGRQTSEIFAAESSADVVFETSGEGTRELFTPDDPATSANIVIDAHGQSSSGIFAPLSEAEIVFDSAGDSTRWIYAIPTDAPVVISVTGQGSRAVFAESTPVEVVIVVAGEPTRSFYSESPAAEISIIARGSAEIYGYSVISLPGLSLPVNGDLVIDTGEMTVTLNGVDVTRYFSADSEFFKLRPGDNLIVYEDGAANRNIYYTILWKDLFL